MGPESSLFVALLCVCAVAASQDQAREPVGAIPTEDELRSTTVQLLLFNPPHHNTNVKALVSSFQHLAGIKAVAENWTDEADKAINVVDLRLMLSVAPDAYDKKIQAFRQAIAEKFDVAREKVHAHPALGHLVEVNLSDGSEDDDDNTKDSSTLDTQSSNVLSMLRSVGKVSTDEQNELPPTSTLEVLFRGWNKQHIVKRAEHLIHLGGHAAVAVDRNNEVPTRAWSTNPHPRAWSYKSGASEVNLHIVISVDRAGFRRERKRIVRDIATYFKVPENRMGVRLVDDKEASSSHRARELARQLAESLAIQGLEVATSEGSDTTEAGMPSGVSTQGNQQHPEVASKDEPRLDTVRWQFFSSNHPSVGTQGEGRGSQAGGDHQTLFAACLLVAAVWLVYLLIRTGLDCRSHVGDVSSLSDLSTDRSGDLRILRAKWGPPVLFQCSEHVHTNL